MQMLFGDPQRQGRDSGGGGQVSNPGMIIQFRIAADVK
jgi:hypothetical protein